VPKFGEDAHRIRIEVTSTADSKLGTYTCYATIAPTNTHKSAVKDLSDIPKSHEIVGPKPKVRLDLENPVRSRPKQVHRKEPESSLVPGSTDTTQP